MKVLKVEQAIRIKVYSLGAVGEARSPHKNWAVWRGSDISHLLGGAPMQALSPGATASCWPRASSGHPPSKGPFGRKRTCCHWAKAKMLRLPSLLLSPPKSQLDPLRLRGGERGRRASREGRAIAACL